MSKCDFSPVEQEVIANVGDHTTKGRLEYLGPELPMRWLEMNSKWTRRIPKKRFALISHAIERLRVDGYIVATDKGLSLTGSGRAVYTHFSCGCPI